MADQFENLESSQEELSSTTRTQECTNCKRSRDISEFIGKRGTPVKRCIRCREKDARQSKRPEVRERKNARAREKNYHIDYRNRKREENEEEFLRHNREKAKEWRDNNKEHLSNWKRTNVVYRLTSAKGQATKKNIPYEITDDFAKELMQKECIYCGKYDAEDSLNGVNRLDVRKGFTPENCVSSCTMCSSMKKCLDPNTFIERACHIASIHQGNFQNIKFDAWPIMQKSVGYNDYRKRANKKGIEFELDLMPGMHPVFFGKSQDLALVVPTESSLEPTKGETKWVSLEELNELAKEYKPANKETGEDGQGIVSGFGKRMHCMSIKTFCLVGSQEAQKEAQETLEEIQKNW